MKKYLYIGICFFFLFLGNTKSLSASRLYISEDYSYIYDENYIKIYKNNIFFNKIEDAKFLDANNNFVLYNHNNSIWLYSFIDNNSILISQTSYNGLIYKNSIIYESDFDSNYACKNVVGAISYRNCYKLYLYNINTGEYHFLNLTGNDLYLNDVYDEKLVYTSIHNRDEVCSSICSFVNVYDLITEKNKIIDKYEELVLDMSGNAFIDENIIYFESVPNIYGCNFTQIFAYNLFEESLDIISKNDSGCFTKNNEILDARNGYLLFKSEFENYENSAQINYIYSYFDDKLTKITNNCRYNDSSLIRYNNIFCIENEMIISYLIDDKPPVINSTKQYSALVENEEKLIQQLEYSDNLSKSDNVKVNILDKLNILGEQLIKVRLCDKFNNCSTSEILVDVIDKDITPPKIYCSETIVIKSNEQLVITKYGYAIDNVDGRIPIEIVNDYDISKSGTYTILIKSEDSNGNVSYEEIQLTVYENFRLAFIYFSILVISFIGVIIIYILRFKKRK